MHQERNQSDEERKVKSSPYAKKPLLMGIYGFRIVDGILKVPLGDRQYFDILLNNHVKAILSDSNLKVRSFTISVNNTVSIRYAKKVSEIEDCIKVV